MSLTTQHEKHVVAYDEAADRWVCAALNLDASSLAGLRQTIDAAEAAQRKLHCRAFLMHPSLMSVTPVIVLEIAPDEASAWITAAMDPGQGWQKVSLKRLIADTPESRQILLRWREASRLWHEAGLTIERMADALPRLANPQVRSACQTS